MSLIANRRQLVYRTVAHAFTLIELLVVIAIVALLLGILLPSLASARESSRATICSSQARQLVITSLLYSGDHKSHLAPGAPNFLANRTRWFGSRAGATGSFASTGGPLSGYLDSGAVRQCPTFSWRLEQLARTNQGFERAGGGYGYNNAYAGVLRDGAAVRTDRSGERADRFALPSATMLFADAAFASGGSGGGESIGSGGSGEVIEYSFAEPRFLPGFEPAAGPAGGVSNAWAGEPARFDPSIAFRHGSARFGSTGSALVAWLDGHTSTESRTFTWASGLYAGDPARAGLGWFGRDDDNRLFRGQMR